MANLKYYSDEFNRFGPMGEINYEQAVCAAQKACEHFDLPRVKIVFLGRRRRYATYRGGLNMIHPSLKMWSALGVPTLTFPAPTNVTTWLTFCHELAHHIHTTRTHKSVVTRIRQYFPEVNTDSSTVQGRIAITDAARKVARKQHAHGPAHRAIMEELVDFFGKRSEMASAA